MERIKSDVPVLYFAAIAQLAERTLHTGEVRGSTPCGGINKLCPRSEMDITKHYECFIVGSNPAGDIGK